MAVEKVPALDPVISLMKDRFSGSPDQLIPLLQFAQEELGYLSPEVMVAIADHLKVPSSHVYGVATFYAQFRFKPLGKNRITVCRGTACHVRGGQKVIDEVTKELGIVDGGTTDDLQFSLETVACIGSCALAPVIVINQKVYGKVTAKRMKQILDEIRGIAPAEEKSEEAEEKKSAKPAGKKAAPPEEEAPAPKPAKKPAKKKPAKKKPAKKTAKKSAKKKPVKAKAVKKTAKKKPVKAKAAKKTAKKKSAKKSAKKKAVQTRAVKKSVKKKPAKKTAKKPAKKRAVKKAVKKSAKKPAPKRGSGKKAVKAGRKRSR